MTGLWHGTVTQVLTGGYRVVVPRYDSSRVWGSTARPVTGPAGLLAGAAVLVGFLENNPDQLVIVRAG